MAYARNITIGEPAGRNCAVTDGRMSVCTCGWSGTHAEAMDHLYGDLTGAARKFADGEMSAYWEQHP